MEDIVCVRMEEMEGTDVDYIYAINEDGSKFLVKWRGFDRYSFVPVKLANRVYTEHVINFYQERIVWTDETGEVMSVQESSEAVALMDSITGASEKKEEADAIDKVGNRHCSDFEPHRIVGMTDTFGGKLTFLIKWKGVREATFVSATEASTHFPQLVIKFYERRCHMFSYNSFDPRIKGHPDQERSRRRKEAKRAARQRKAELFASEESEVLPQVPKLTALPPTENPFSLFDTRSWWFDLRVPPYLSDSSEDEREEYLNGAEIYQAIMNSNFDCDSSED